MKKIFIMILALTVLFTLGGVAMADTRPGGDVSFDVNWTVNPKIYFGVYKWDGSSTFDYAGFEDGSLIYGVDNFADVVFEEMTPNIFDPFGHEEVYGDIIAAVVFSNDDWKVQFNKPVLISDNDHYTTVPVYAQRHFANLYNEADSTTGWFAGNDTIVKDMGGYGMMWNLKVEYDNFLTRAGNYSRTYEIICTQL